MKKIVSFFVMLIVFFNSSFCYADNDVDTFKVPDSVFTDLRKEHKYDSKTDTYYFSVNDVDRLQNDNSKSATVAVSGAVISSILALGVKAGLEFVTSNSMSEFVNRFFMLDGISGLASNLNNVVKNSVNGTLDFSRSLLDTIGSKFSEIMSKGDVYSTYVKGRKIMTINHTSNGNISSVLARYLFENSSVPRVSFYGEQISDRGVEYNFDSNIFLPIGDFGNFSIEGYIQSSSPYRERVYGKYKTEDGSYNYLYSQYSYVQFSDVSFQKGFRFYSIPFLSETSNNKYYVGFIVAAYSTVTGYLSEVVGTVTYGSFAKSHAGSPSVLPVIGDSWSSGSIPGTDNTYSSDLGIRVPIDTNNLVNKAPSDISTPSYETWSPGVTVVPPTVDTGTSDAPADDLYPPITDSDSPGDDSSGSDTETDKPSTDNSISWDWLKTLLNTLLNLIQGIFDWISSFWDRLTDVLSSLLSFEWLGDLLSSILEVIQFIYEWINNFWDILFEFIKSIFVPSDGYFIGKFNDILVSIKERVPGIDIDKLKQLAVGEYKFKDVYANFFGIECLVVKGSVINDVVVWSRAIIQGLISIFLLLYNYNQIYKLIRGGSLVGSTCSNDGRGV